MGPGSAEQHFVLHRVRDTRPSHKEKGRVLRTPALMMLILSRLTGGIPTPPRAMTNLSDACVRGNRGNLETTANAVGARNVTGGPRRPTTSLI